jgi:hypothetical protein
VIVAFLSRFLGGDSTDGGAACSPIAILNPGRGRLAIIKIFFFLYSFFTKKNSRKFFFCVWATIYHKYLISFIAIMRLTLIFNLQLIIEVATTDI